MSQYYSELDFETKELLYQSAINGDIDIIKDIVNKEKIPQFALEFALMNASQYGHLSIIKFLIDKYNEFKYDYFDWILNECLVKAVIGNQIDIVQYYISLSCTYHEHSDTPFYYALQNRNIDMVKTLLQNGADIMMNNCVCFEYAIQFGVLEIVQYIVEIYKINVNYEDGYPLQYAIMKQQYDIAKYLLENGAKPHLSNDKPLKIAVLNKNIELINLLIQYGVDIIPHKEKIIEILGEDIYESLLSI